jgi:hypothetical protein
MGRTQPVRDEDFMAWAQSLNARCTERQTDWGFDPATVQKLNTLTHEAIEAYDNNLDIATRNRTSRVLKTAGIAALRSFLRIFTLTLRANEAIGEEDLAALGLPLRKRHTRLPLPAPTEEPEVYIVTEHSHFIKVYVRVPQYGHPTKSRTRKAYHGFVLRYRREGDAEWRDEYTTRLHIDLFFTDEDAGKRFVLAAAWINPRLQHGPWSHELSVVVN